MPDDPPIEKHEHNTLNFPDNFLWGAATSAHQVEGNNTNSDWWDWEIKNQPAEKHSGVAANQYQLYAEDFKLAQQLGHNAHRLSIEWARIEPVEGQFDQAEIEHYKQVLKSLKEQNLKVMLTLWHFTLPAWLAKKGGWENGKSVKYFERFLKKIVPEIAADVDLWITLNEPQVYTFMSYIFGAWPPQKKSYWKAFWVTLNLAKAHKKAYKVIHKYNKSAQVGISVNVTTFTPFHKHSIRELLASFWLDMVNNHFFYMLTGIKTHDFIGINYYFHRYISFNGDSRWPSFVDITTTKKEVSDMGWEINPGGMFEALVDFSDYHKPIYITENGLASTNDDRRCRFLIAYLQEIYHAVSVGVKVKGYFHWALLDNFEWADGFKPRFGLIEVDYKTQKRTPRDSAYVYAEIAKKNGIPHRLLRFLGHTVDASEVLKSTKTLDT